MANMAGNYYGVPGIPMGAGSGQSNTYMGGQNWQQSPFIGASIPPYLSVDEIAWLKKFINAEPLKRSVMLVADKADEK